MAIIVGLVVLRFSLVVPAVAAVMLLAYCIAEEAIRRVDSPRECIVGQREPQLVDPIRTSVDNQQREQRHCHAHGARSCLRISVGTEPPTSGGAQTGSVAQVGRNPTAGIRYQYQIPLQASVDVW